MGQLELQISTKQAVASLKALDASLGRLQSTLKGFDGKGGFATFMKQAQSFKGIPSSAATSVNRLNSAVSSLSTKQLTNAQNGVRKIVAESGKLNSATANVKKFGGAMKGLGGVLNRARGFLAGFGIALGGIGLARLIKGAFEATTAMQRFTIVMETIGGSAEFAAEQMDFVKRVSLETATSLEVSIKAYTKFAAATKTAGFTTKDTQKVFENMSKVFRVMNLSAQDSQLAFLALEQMVSKGKVSMEELRRQLGERLPGAMNIMAKALGVTTAELDKMIRNGEVGSESIIKFSETAVEALASKLPDAIKTPQAALTQLTSAVFILKSAFGQAFFEAIIPAVNRLTEALKDDSLIDQIREIGSVMGTAAGMFIDAVRFMIQHWEMFGIAFAVIGTALTGFGFAAVIAGFTSIAGAIAGVTTAATILSAVPIIALWVGIGTAVVTAGFQLTDFVKRLFSVKDAQDQVNSTSDATMKSVMSEVDAYKRRNANLQANLITLNQQVSGAEKLLSTNQRLLASAQQMTEAEREAAGLSIERLAAIEEENGKLQEIITAKKQEQSTINSTIQSLNKEKGVREDQLVTAQETARSVEELAIANGEAAGTASELATQAGDMSVQTALAGDKTKELADKTVKYNTQGATSIETAGNATQQYDNLATAASKAATATLKLADATKELNDVRGNGGSGGGGGSSDVNARKQGGKSHVRSGPVQSVPNSMFAGAPQFAEGGLTGGGFPAILHPNEAVIPLAGGKVPVDLGTAGPAAASANASNQGMVINQKQFKAMISAWSGMKTELARVKEAINTMSLVNRDGLRGIEQAIMETRSVLMDILQDFQKLFAMASAGSGSTNASGVSGGTSSFRTTGEGGRTTAEEIQFLKDNVSATSNQIIQDSIRSAGPTSGGGYKINFNLKKSDELFKNERALIDALLENAVAAGDLAKAERLRAAQSVHTQSANATNFDLASGFTTSTLGGMGSNVSFAKGTLNTSDHMLPGQTELPATLHRGEMVIPAGMSSEIRKGSGGGGGSVVVNMTVNTPDANSFKQSEDQIVQELITKFDTVKRQNGTEHFNEDPTRKVRD